MLEDDTALNATDEADCDEELGNLVLAYNRRLDVTLNATGQESALTYPVNADDFGSLVDRNGPKQANV